MPCFPYCLENEDLLRVLEEKDFLLCIFRLACDELFKRATNPTDHPLTNEELIKLLKWLSPSQRREVIEARSVGKRLLGKSLKYIEDIKDLQELEKEIKKILSS